MVWDPISFSLATLTAWVTLLSVGSWTASPPSPSGGLWLVAALGGAVLVAFTSSDLFWFFVAFEASLVPLFLLIGRWGSRREKEKASLFFFFYTFISSTSFLAAAALAFALAGSTSLAPLKSVAWGPAGAWVVLCLLTPLLVKLPAWPVHLWLPLAHVEAPTSCSILLAALVLKLSGCGLIRWVLPLWGEAPSYFFPSLSALGAISLASAALVAARQGDLKRLVAYSSVSHMGLLTLACTGSAPSLSGATLLMAAHGLTSGGLFAWVGMVYFRLHSRSVRYLRGLWASAPVATWCLLLLTLASMGFPPSINFVSEVLVLAGALPPSWGLAPPLVVGLTAGAFYHLFLFGRAAFGPPPPGPRHLPDLSRAETLECVGWAAPAWALGLGSPLW